MCRQCLCRKVAVGGSELCRYCRKKPVKPKQRPAKKMCERCNVISLPKIDQSVCHKCKKLERSEQRRSMPCFLKFADVDRSLPSGAYIRITDEGWYNGVYRIRNGGNNAQGHVWGAWVFPGPYIAGSSHRGWVPAPLRRWGDELPPGYEYSPDD